VRARFWCPPPDWSATPGTVTARTSSFAFKGQDVNIGTIARKPNLGAILEGSVRRSGHTVRITAQLINAVTGFHLWSKTYDRTWATY
jgi:adenylate cyclase